jgi:hypothetical protein
MDTQDVNTAVNVMRVGQSGIGFSHNGVNGPYKSAWTIDGRFIADFIATGTISNLNNTFSIDIDNENIMFNNKDQKSIGAIRSAPGGVQFASYDLNSNSVAEMFVVGGKPRLSVGHAGMPYAFMEYDPTSKKGITHTDIINGKEIYWKPNDDGTYTLTGK